MGGRIQPLSLPFSADLAVRNRVWYAVFRTVFRHLESDILCADAALFNTTALSLLGQRLYFYSLDCTMGMFYTKGAFSTG